MPFSTSEAGFRRWSLECHRHAGTLAITKRLLADSGPAFQALRGFRVMAMLTDKAKRAHYGVNPSVAATLALFALLAYLIWLYQTDWTWAA
jgi:hypothetical protein